MLVSLLSNPAINAGGDKGLLQQRYSLASCNQVLLTPVRILDTVSTLEIVRALGIVRILEIVMTLGIWMRTLAVVVRVLAAGGRDLAIVVTLLLIGVLILGIALFQISLISQLSFTSCSQMNK